MRRIFGTKTSPQSTSRNLIDAAIDLLENIAAPCSDCYSSSTRFRLASLFPEPSVASALLASVSLLSLPEPSAAPNLPSFLTTPPFLIGVPSQRLLPAPKGNKRMMRNIQLDARPLARRPESRPGKGLPGLVAGVKRPRDV
jgi:hypothetical protein